MLASHLLSWSNICFHKDFGGLGLRKLAEKNLALLAKWIWRSPPERRKWKHVQDVITYKK